MDRRALQQRLDSNGELLVTLASAGYDEPIELHIHDTTFGNGGVKHSLADGEIWFSYGDIESVTIHQQTTTDLGL